MFNQDRNRLWLGGPGISSPQPKNLEIPIKYREIESLVSETVSQPNCAIWAINKTDYNSQQLPNERKKSVTYASF